MRTINKLLISTLGLCCIFGTTAFAAEIEERTVNIELNNNVQVVDARVETLQTAVAENISKYDLRKKLHIDVYHQGNSNACWSFALRTAFETTLKNTLGHYREVSNYHMAYATSNSFSDGDYEFGLERDSIADFGSALIGLGYLTNGSGPVSEFGMEFSDTQKDISVSEVTNKEPLYKVEEWREFPAINKTIELGNLKYQEDDVEITKNRVNKIRNEIKQHILNYGAVVSTIYYDPNQYYNSQTNSFYVPANALSGVEGNHTIAIIGWDDNYSKDNFTNKPINDGAYLVQNSYGNDKTYFYVSYDDVFIEAETYGITKIVNIDYENIYQHDGQGTNYSVTISGQDEIYTASVFERNSSEIEFLTEVAITTSCEVDYEIYVNTQDGTFDEIKLVKVAESSKPIKPGYHTIKLKNSLTLENNKFSIVVKYKRVNEQKLEISLLSQAYKNNWYNTLDKTLGECFVGASLGNMQDTNTGATAIKTCIKAFTKKIDDSFNLADTIKINSKNQGLSNNCWTMPITTVLETNQSIENGYTEEYSVRHMDYATSQSFSNVSLNEYGYDRLVNTAGTAEWGLAYFTNGIGAVYEMSMPFTETYGDIEIEEITDVVKILKVEDWIQFPKIVKEITDTGVRYLNEKEEEYTEQEVNAIREKIKLHIMNNGAIATETYIDGINEYYNEETHAYYCTDDQIEADHGLAIIGWDDNYPKENFNEGYRPEGDGAYIVQNSWGENEAVAEQFYVSYYDPIIEKKLYGIINATEKDNTETIYQYDELGRNTSFSVSNGDVYGANVFERDAREEEYLKEISIATYNEMNYEVYVNAGGDEISSETMTLVAKSTTPIENGYHTVKFEEPIELTGDSFVVAVKYMGTAENLVSMQARVDGSPYDNVTSYAGESFVGHSLDNMEDIQDIEALPEGNLCIKAFTNKTSSTFSVIKGDVNLDGKVTATDLSLLKMHLVGLITLRGHAYDAADMNSDGIISSTDLALLKNLIVSDDNSDGKPVITIGDANLDGRVSATDLSMLKRHLVGLITLEGAAFIAADMNEDSKLSATDLAILKKKIVGME